MSIHVPATTGRAQGGIGRASASVIYVGSYLPLGNRKKIVFGVQLNILNYDIYIIIVPVHIYDIYHILLSASKIYRLIRT
jgi:hypothetical protein